MLTWRRTKWCTSWSIVLHADSECTQDIALMATLACSVAGV